LIISIGIRIEKATVYNKNRKSAVDKAIPIKSFHCPNISVRIIRNKIGDSRIPGNIRISFFAFLRLIFTFEKFTAITKPKQLVRKVSIFTKFSIALSEDVGAPGRNE